ncbi:NAD(P)-binding protein [Cyathus striatus]|nr:NAD(P)-binding protein [Cyathus striatus]
MAKVATKGIAIVTGAARGLGRGIAARLARDGFDIALNDLPSSESLLDEFARELSSTERRIIIVPADVSKEEDVKRMIQRTVEQLGRLDVMVANAGIFQAKGFFDTTVEDLDRLYETNTRGTFLCFKYAAEQMVNEKHGGRLIAASSLAGQHGQPTVTGYSSTNVIDQFSDSLLAAELGKFGITVNAYAPGTIEDTPAFIAAGVAIGDPEGWRKAGAAATSVGFNGITADIANLVSFLASEESRFITGQTIAANGGRICT